ncbi:MAG TPA: DUF4236 domain-containing protein [Candidatus Avamphibacillus sp.]|nr:DUF4236 domain-containing protein [Candidatus Avamphibacillus sp.]
MGFRFSKSMKIGKNTRVNFGKTGVGLSFGAKGLRRTLHSSGRKTTSAGIPGSGLYYTKSSSKKAGSHSTNTSQSKQQRVEENQTAVDTFNEYIQMITSLHKITPESIDWEHIKAIPAPFDTSYPGPLESKAIDNSNNYTPNFIHRLFRLENRKRTQLEKQIMEAKQQDAANYREWEESHELAARVLRGEHEAFLQVIEEMNAFSVLEELGTGFKLNVKTDDTVEVAFSVNPEEVVPEKALSLTKTGRLSRKKMTKTNYYRITQDYVCSMSLQVAKIVFARLPIEKVIVNTTENRLNTATGNREDTVVLSVAFEREIMDRLNYENIDPADAMQNFEHHMKHLKTAGFKPVEKI